MPCKFGTGIAITHILLANGKGKPADNGFDLGLEKDEIDV